MSDTVDIEIESEGDEQELDDDVDAESVDPGVTADVEEDVASEDENDEPFEGERAISFGDATGTLAESFDIDAHKGETITDLSTVETEDGQQLVATVEHRRRTALSARLADARRTGRRVGTVALLVGIAAVAISAVRRSRRDDDGLEITDTEASDLDER
ncbi:hypothetical protein [Halomarina oriensis]|uniref:Uncharacterized protein n=1 Tax=Halomarina oriensis TaxID=671145 RepID=A0A6B0GPL7_9EURY|nr:hypothetical protein [Halomarina oriensis]MWG36670.1 hypothetical protein [Halomarina oriensis]